MIKQLDASNDSHRSILHSTEVAILHIIVALAKYLTTMLCLIIKKMCSTYTVDIFSITAIINKKAFQLNTDHLQMGYTNMLSAPMTFTLTQWVIMFYKFDLDVLKIYLRNKRECSFEI